MRHPLSRSVLMTPGPVEEPWEARLAGLAWREHHRTPEFAAMFLRVSQACSRLIGTRRPTALLAASGTGGLEAAVANFLAEGERAVVVISGKFGERWAKLLEAYGHGCETVEAEGGKAVRVGELREVLSRGRPGLVFATLQETSTGVRHDIEAFAAACREHGSLLVVDTVSGLGCLPYRMDEWGVDVTVAGSQKGLLSPPGVAMCAWSEAAERKRAEARGPRFYFDLGKYLKKLERAPFTPPATLVAQLDFVLARLESVGLDAVLAAVETAARATVEAARALGLETLSDDVDRSTGLTTLKVPAGVDGERLLADARSASGVRIAGGQDEWKGRILRVGHMGATTPGDLLGAILGLEGALARQGWNRPAGVGVAAAAAVLAGGNEGGA